MSKKEFEKEVTKITEEIKKKYKPKKIIIFGSAAFGKVTKESDLDLFIIKKTSKKWRERIIEVYGYIMDRSIPVDVIVYTPKEVKKRQEIGDFFIEEIFNKGKLVYDKEKEFSKTS